MAATPTLAVFDLDGTLIPGDTCARFLVLTLVRRPSAWLRAPLLALRFAAFALGRLPEARFKEAAFTALLAGVDPDRQKAAGQAFAARLAGRLRPGGAARLREHRRAGHVLVLATASPDIYAEPLARELGLDGCVCTHTERGPDGRLTGLLAGENCKRAAKLAALKVWLADRPEGKMVPGAAGGIDHVLEAWKTTAYTDHEADLPLLLAVDRPVAVNPTRALGREAEARGWAVEDWSGL